MSRVLICILVCGEWTGWSECSKTCGNGAQYRERNCTEEYNNRNSSYNEGQGQYCNPSPCPLGKNILFIVLQSFEIIYIVSVI